MNITDLGELKGPVAVFGGAYSNLQATRAFLERAKTLGVAAGNLVFTGDALGYCADPVATWAELRAAGVHMIAGNVERQLGAGAADCGCGFDAGSACNLLADGWYGHADAQTTPSMRAEMRALPDWLVFRHAGRRYVAIHGGADDVARFVWPDATDALLIGQIEQIKAVTGPVDVVLCGHSGIPFVRHTPAGHWINAGAIGMPPHDGDRATRFVVLDGGGPSVHNINYDWQAAANEMERAGLAQGYDRALATGWWPSEDSLPPGLRLGRVA